MPGCARLRRQWFAPATLAARSLLGIRRAVRRLVGRLLERHDLRLAALLQEDLDSLLRGLERGLTVAGEGDAALESLQRLVERQVATLEALDQSLELRQRLLEIGGFAVARQVHRSSGCQRSPPSGRATLHSAPREGQRGVDVPGARA